MTTTDEPRAEQVRPVVRMKTRPATRGFRSALASRLLLAAEIVSPGTLVVEIAEPDELDRRIRNIAGAEAERRLTTERARACRERRYSIGY